MKLVHFLIGAAMIFLIIAGLAWLLSINPLALILALVFLFFLYQVTNLPDHRTRYRD